MSSAWASQRGFFATLRIPMVGGRDFRDTDVAPGLDAAKQPVAGVGIVNEAFARRYFGGRNPVGRRVSMRQWKDVDAPLDIVGVVADTAYRPCARADAADRVPAA